jgi:hypothetical protein
MVSSLVLRRVDVNLTLLTGKHLLVAQSAHSNIIRCFTSLS